MTDTTPHDEARRLLASDHSELDALLRDLRAKLAGGDAEGASARLDLFWARLAVHIRAENLHLFPAVLRALQGDDARREAASLSADETGTLSGANVRASIARLRDDHDFFMRELARAVKASRESRAAGGVSAASDNDEQTTVAELSRIVSAVEARLAAHNELEEEVVYRLPATLLSDEERSELAARVGRELDNLPPRFSQEGAGDAKARRHIVGFERDEEGHWRAELECGHFQHVRHDPPLVTRHWVLTEEGRASRLGVELGCKRCDEETGSDE